MKRTIPQPGSDWIAGGGDMGELIRSMDWSQTPLGSIASWPQSLRTTVNLCLASDLPICLIWGDELVQLYNDAYRVICGDKHPHSMGQNFRECWLEAWPVIGAAHDSALSGDTAFLENQNTFLERHGYVEECFFTFSFSPIRDETGRLAGLFHPVIETTSKMLGERRTRTLRDLASRTSNAKSVEEVFALTTGTLAECQLDLPFLLIYRRHETEQHASLVAATGLTIGAKGAPEVIALNEPDHVTWPLGEVFRSGEAMTVDDVSARFGDLFAGPFPEPIASAVLLPVTPPGAEQPVKVVIAGISPRLKSNEMYGGFHDQLRGVFTNAVASARAYEEERKRAEALAQIDRAKTVFVSNVSHEFRTPLTLLLGPTEELLALPPDAFPPNVRTQLDLVHRNSLRLQKLVNSLLDFARLEAGGIQASFEPVDLAALTSDLASVFSSAIEKAGLKFTVDCPLLPETVYVDREMWEKVVLNLISNAFKFTLTGEIEIMLRNGGGAASLSVRDTGAGIAAAELPRVFERFHRIEGTVARTHEGTGIGLALVRELVTLHGGAVAVESVFGKGSVFTVTLPTGAAHLPPDRIESARSLPSTAAAAIFVEEAERWLPAELSYHELTHATRRADDGSPLIVVADDNADMREYVRRLLAAQFRVETAPDGQAALELIHAHAPDLLITDVMMPRLDGFGLVARLRSDEKTREMPIILLSARAGEESRVEGLEAGADDYLVKPFSTRELLARVESQLKLAAIRRESREKMREVNRQLEERVLDLQQARSAALNVMQDAVLTSDALRRSEDRYRSLFTSMDEGYCIIEVIFDKNQKAIDWEYLDVNPAFEKQTGLADSRGKRAREMVPDLEEHWFEVFGKVALTGDPVRLEQYSESLGGRCFDIYALRTGDPEMRRVAVVFSDITERRKTEDALKRSREELEVRVEKRTRQLSEANQKFKDENQKRLQVEEHRVSILRRLASAQEDERGRIGRDMHDQIGQQITALRLKLVDIRSKGSDFEFLMEQLVQVEKYAKQIDFDAGSLAYQLRPPGIDDLGLRASVNDFVISWSHNHNIPIEFYSPATERRPLNAEASIHVYRIVQEALNNVLKHAQAKSVEVILEFRGDKLILVIEDDGIGFDPGIKQAAVNGRGRLGLVGMRERCLIIGGTMSIESKPGEGTVILCRFPAEALNDRSLTAADVQ